jgi:hypothetical protein
MPRPRKLVYPLKLEEWLRIALRGIRLEDRMNICRAWRRWYLIFLIKRKPTEQEVDEDIKNFQQLEFCLSNQEMKWIDSLRHDFLPLYRRENRIKRAQVAATKRWSKKNSKTS